MSGKTTVILGGGTGGLVAANRLRSLLGREHRIVVVDRRPDHLFYASLLWLMTGAREPEAISRPLARLARKGIDFHQSAVEAVDLRNRRVRTGVGDLAYDHLVVALGAETAMEAVPGLAESGCNLYELDGVMRLRAAINRFEGGQVVVLVSRLPYRCPAAPYEAALLLDDFFRRKQLRSRTGISVYSPEPRPMPAAGPQAGQTVAGLLAERNIAYYPAHSLERVQPENARIQFSNGTVSGFDLLVVIPPHFSPEAVRKSGLADESGWVPVEPHTMETREAGVYAVGDVTGIRLSGGLMLPKAGVFAHYQAETAAHNLAAAIQGRKVRHRFKGFGLCILEAGQGTAGLASGRFYSQPQPAVRMRNPSRIWHWSKVAFEKWWLWRWF